MNANTPEGSPMPEIPAFLLNREIDIASLLPPVEAPEDRAMRIVIIGASASERESLVSALQIHDIDHRPVHSVAFVEDSSDRLKEMMADALRNIVVDFTGNDELRKRLTEVPEAPKFESLELKPFRKPKLDVDIRPDSRPKWTFDGRPKGRRYI